MYLPYCPCSPGNYSSSSDETTNETAATKEKEWKKKGTKRKRKSVCSKPGYCLTFGKQFCLSN